MSLNEYLIELASFNDLARFVCAAREYPRRVYSHLVDGTRVLSSTQTFSNTLLVLYCELPKYGKYISYQARGGAEICSVVESTKDISHYAPIIHAASSISSLPVVAESTDQFHPIELQDLGSLARLTYDPELPEEPDLTLYAIPYKESWVMGYITSLDLNELIYHFNYVRLETEPTKPFLKYRGNYGQDPEFDDSFDHGYTYLPIIKIKQSHQIFGL